MTKTRKNDEFRGGREWFGLQVGIFLHSCHSGGSRKASDRIQSIKKVAKIRDLLFVLSGEIEISQIRHRNHRNRPQYRHQRHHRHSRRKCLLS